MDQVPRPAPNLVAAVNQPPKPRPLAPRQTRKPTGKPSWPVILIAGGEKAGKSWQCAKASASPLIGMAYWIGFGEKDPDEYGALPGANFEIVPHDGTLGDFYDAIRHSSQLPPAVEGKKNLLIIDSSTRVWDQLRDEATMAAAARGSRDKNGEIQVGSDLWNKANGRWALILEAARMHDGPVIITARMDTVTVFNDTGKPTKQKTDKIKAQKGLPYDVDAIIEMPERGQATLTGVRSVIFNFPDRVDIPWLHEEGMDGFWRRLGLAEVETVKPVYTEPVNNEAI